MSLNGKIATKENKSSWISGEKSRTFVQMIRSNHDAILIGTKTAFWDNPRLNLRDQFSDLPQPAKIIIDKDLKLSKKMNFTKSKTNERLFFVHDLNLEKDKIKSIEDPFAENDWLAWNKLMRSINKVQIVGDDLYVTNLERLKKGFLNISSNSILIKLNQIGTVSETLDVIKFAQTIGYKTIISHRSGDSEDTFIADLAVGTNSNQIKTGSLARSERVAKYNQLIRIEEELGKKVRMNKIN